VNLRSAVEASKVIIEVDVGKSGLGTKNHRRGSRTIKSNQGSKAMNIEGGMILDVNGDEEDECWS